MRLNERILIKRIYSQCFVMCAFLRFHKIPHSASVSRNLIFLLNTRILILSGVFFLPLVYNTSSSPQRHELLQMYGKWKIRFWDSVPQLSTWVGWRGGGYERCMFRLLWNFRLNWKLSSVPLQWCRRCSYILWTWSDICCKAGYVRRVSLKVLARHECN